MGVLKTEREHVNDKLNHVAVRRAMVCPLRCLSEYPAFRRRFCVCPTVADDICAPHGQLLLKSATSGYVIRLSRVLVQGFVTFHSHLTKRDYPRS